MKKRILSLALVLLMVVAFVPSALALDTTDGVPDYYKDSVTIENGICIVKEEIIDYSFVDGVFKKESKGIMQILSISNATSLGTLNPYDSPIVYVSSPATITLFYDAPCDGLRGEIYKMSLDSSGEFDWDNRTEINIATGAKSEDSEYTLTGSTYVLEEGYYRAFNTDGGGMYIFVSGSATSTPEPAPAPVEPTPAPEPAPAPEVTTPKAEGTATVANCYFVNVRKGAGVSYDAFTYLTKGDVVTVLETNGSWVKVDTAKGQGWVYGEYLAR